MTLVQLQTRVTLDGLIPNLSKKIYDLLKEMNKGDISKPIKKQNAVLFLKINDKRISKSEKY